MHHQTHGVQLPVSFQQVDGSCINNSLPAHNDIFPPLQFLQGANTDTIAYAISLFRTYAQSRAGKSPIHCFTYNILQMNRFNNQLFTGWCQVVADLCDFLERGQQVPAATAADKAASRVYQVLMASLCQQYPAIQQYLDQTTLAGLNDAAKLGVMINNDITQFKNRIQGGQGVGVPNMGVGSPGMVHQPMGHGAHIQSFAVTGVGQQTTGHNPTASVSTDGLSGMLLDSTPSVAPAKPTSSWTASNIAQDVVVKPAAATVQTQASDNGIIEHDMRAPMTVADIQVDPNYYVPKGHVIDPARPYDHIRNPGGVEIRPAYQVPKWSVTRGSDNAYPQVYNPTTHIRFLARWVDGVVKEVIVPYGPEMDYLKHEINQELLSKAMRPKGIVVPLPKYNQSEQPVQPLEAVKDSLADSDDNLEAKLHLPPVSIEELITGSTDLENESIARSIVVRELELDEDDPVPPHEYISVKVYGMDISDACYQKLVAFSKLTTPVEMVAQLKQLVESGELALRYYNFIVKRLTQGVNDLLRDSLSIQGVRIDDFVEDAVALAPYLKSKKGAEFEQVYLGSIQSIAKRMVSMGEEIFQLEGSDEDQKRYGVIDEYLNYQLGIASEHLSNLNLTEEACVVSPISHPAIIHALRAMKNRAEESGILDRARLRLISSDGFYYEVIVGKLVKGALLLKRL